VLLLAGNSYGDVLISHSDVGVIKDVLTAPARGAMCLHLKER